MAAARLTDVDKVEDEAVDVVGKCTRVCRAGQIGKVSDERAQYDLLPSRQFLKARFSSAFAIVPTVIRGIVAPAPTAATALRPMTRPSTVVA